MKQTQALLKSLLMPLAALVLTIAPKLRAVDLTDGLARAVPVQAGKAPVIDGNLDDWNLNAQEPIYISEQTASHMWAEWAFMYDDEAFYVSARVGLPLRPYTNRNNPQDAFWTQDILQLRMAADPALPYPLERNRDSKSNRISHISIWKNTDTGTPYVNIAHGTRFDQGGTTNPPGSTVVLKDGETEYIVEARIPWSSLNAPGGKMPIRIGGKAPFIFETLWIGGDRSRVASCYVKNPGTFAFQYVTHWGQIEFSSKAPAQRLRPTIEQIHADLAPSSQAVLGAPEGVPITIDVPQDGMKAALNIFGPNGEVLRELLGAQPLAKGTHTIKWDGRDNWGHPLKTGAYTWGAYLHHGLKAEYAGSVGASGQPFYPTPDAKGGWGGDHGNPIAVATDASGIYMLWPVSEMGRAIIKTDHNSNVIWRRNPFVGGGFGPFYAIASDGRHVYVTRGEDQIFLVRLDAKTGALLTWENHGGLSEIPLYKTSPATLHRTQTATSLDSFVKKRPALNKDEVFQPDPLGLVIRDGRIYISSYAENKIFVMCAASGKVTSELPCPGPRGLAFDKNGALLATSFQPKKFARVLRFANPASNNASVLIDEKSLEAPFGIAVSADGKIHISDLGSSQQVKTFSATGAPEKLLGKKGGRPWQGPYDPSAFLNPAGLAFDTTGALIVVESSPPKVISRLLPNTSETLNRWYGPGVYWNSTWPMPDDPTHVFYMLTGAIGRGRMAGTDKTGVPDAYWDLAPTEFSHIGDLEKGIPSPKAFRADNGLLYIVSDSTQSIILLENDLMRPVATWRPVSQRAPHNTSKKPWLDIWADANGDGLVQPGEKIEMHKMPDGSDLPQFADQVGAMQMEPNGDLLFVTQANKILKIPATDFKPGGLITWDISRATWAIPEVLPGQTQMHTTWRRGILGVDRDKHGNHYVVFNARLQGKGGSFDYPDEKTAAAMLNGMGHTASFNAVKFAKYNPAGKLIWMAGRKATAGELPGEMYHFWNLSGMIDDRYIAATSEWGRIYLYTHDGFYIDALMNNPGEVQPQGPYTFGGETGGATVSYFQKTGEVWAYVNGRVFRVHGFEKGRVIGEQRLSGKIALDKIYDFAPPAGAADRPSALRIAKLPASTAMLPAASVWKDIEPMVLRRAGSAFAETWIGATDKALHVRIKVRDETPLENSSNEIQLAFKGGDTAGIVIGPARDSAQPGHGDVRLMAAMIGGQSRLIGMKTITASAQDKRNAFAYTTPSAGTVHFDFVGEVPGARVLMEKTSSGYEATFSVPLAFLDFDLKPGATLRGDVEVRFSGSGLRGLQTIMRTYLFTPDRADTTMTDDIPTEARMYPAFWNPVEIK